MFTSGPRQKVSKGKCCNGIVKHRCIFVLASTYCGRASTKQRECWLLNATDASLIRLFAAITECWLLDAANTGTSPVRLSLLLHSLACCHLEFLANGQRRATNSKRLDCNSVCHTREYHRFGESLDAPLRAQEFSSVVAQTVRLCPALYIETPCVGD